jgi:fructose-specific phosphotransferase system IIC component
LRDPLAAPMRPVIRMMAGIAMRAHISVLTNASINAPPTGTIKRVGGMSGLALLKPFKIGALLSMTTDLLRKSKARCRTKDRIYGA